ncbi:MAG TPA: MFS transporter, partial [Acidobacteriaceae bacterium]|nr:MFS transporter [Acidobacteriaceae bacterium]
PITTHLGWRAAFFVGSPVAVLIAIFAWLAPESRAWHTQRAASLAAIFRSLWSHGRLFLYLLAFMAVMLCLSHGTQDLYPDFLKSLPGIASQKLLGMDLLYGIPVLYNIAAIIGSLAFGYFSERAGRRISIAIGLVLSLISIPAWAFGTTMLVLVAGSCVMQAGVQGAWGVIPAHINELSPPSVRGLFPGFIYQLGFIIASPATIIELRLKSALGYSWALTVFEAGVIIVLLVLIGYGPEARGRDFSTPDAGIAWQQHLPAHEGDGLREGDGLQPVRLQTVKNAALAAEGQLSFTRNPQSTDALNLPLRASEARRKHRALARRIGFPNKRGL